MALHNRVSAEARKAELMKETFRRRTLSFYQYVPIRDPEVFRDSLYQALDELQVFGRIYVACEGINAQISVPEFNLDRFRDFLGTLGFPGETRLNFALQDDGKSFWVLKIKVRDRIVADGITDPTFSMTRKGRYLDAGAFNQITDNPDTIVVDMRNHYEYEVGHFESAIEIPSDTFREQLPMAVEMLRDQKDRPIVMYCTGGIRCEKASAWMLHNGFTQVYHLEGGILNYTRQARQKGLPLKFHGKNFVFDERLGERVTDEVISRCHQCGRPSDHHTNCRNEACHLLFIQCEECARRYEGCCSEACRDTASLPAEARKSLRKGTPQTKKIFNKSRHRPAQDHDTP
jgi:UPF0176 protein